MLLEVDISYCLIQRLKGVFDCGGDFSKLNHRDPDVQLMLAV